MKTTYKILLAVLLVMSALICVVSAEDYAPAVFKTTPIEARQSDTFSTILYLEENSNLIDFEFRLTYDTDLVRLDSAVAPETLVGDIVITPEEGAVHISYTRTSANLKKKTDLVNLTFFVKDSVGPDAYDFLRIDETSQTEAHTMIGDDLFALPIETAFEPLNIYYFGDVNLSGNVSIADVTYLRQYLAEMRTFSAYQEAISDAYYDNDVTLKDAVRIQQYLANKTLMLGNRVYVDFIDKNGEKRWTKSVVFGNSLSEIPALPTYTGYYGGIWSYDPNEADGVDFQNLEDSLTVYAVYKKDASPAVTFYKERLTSVYYSEQTLTGNLNLISKITYQDGYTADIYWSSSDSATLNATTGAFNKPAYDGTVTLTATIISYWDGLIEAQDYIAFDYTVKGEFLCPTKAEIEEYLAGVLGSSIDYNMTLPSKVTNENIAASDKFEVRLSWFQIEEDGSEHPVVQLSRANNLQNLRLVAVATFNGKPLEDDGRMYFENIELSTVTAAEIRNYIISQIAANTGLSVTNGQTFWADDDKYDTVITWISKNKDVADIENNTISINNVLNGTALPINVEVTYTINGEQGSFTLPYTMSVVTNNSLLSPGSNIDPELYKALKAATGVNGNLTTEALKNVKFVYLDLSGYPDIRDLSALTYCTNLRVLNISGLQVDEASLNQIATLTKLEALIANHCGIETMTIGGEPVLDRMINLKMLDLSYNNLTSLDSVFSKKNRYGQLLELYLNDNQLYDISALCDVVDEESYIYDGEGNIVETVTTPTVVNRAPMLQFLILDNNHLDDQDLAAFSNFKVLKYLSLGNNDITTLSGIKDIRTLLELHLQNNRISDIRELRYLTNLENLYLSHNQIRNVFSGSKENNVSYLKYLTKLQILYLNGNDIEDVSYLSALDKLAVLNVNDNRIQSLACLADKGDTMVELYAENNEIDTFSFIRNLKGLTRLLLSNNSGVYESSLNGYLSGLTNLRSLTLSGKDLRNLSFLASMPNLVRLDVANCNLPSYYPTSYSVEDGEMKVSGYVDNIAAILSLKSSLKYLDVSNNGLGYESEGMKQYLASVGDQVDSIESLRITGGTPLRFESLYEMTGLEVLYADNLAESTDANRLFTLMTGLKYLSMENSGITDASWLYRFRNLIYLDLADNSIDRFGFDDLSTRSQGVLTHLYLDTEAGGEFDNSSDVFDGNVLKELSLKGMDVAAMDKLPNMTELEYLDLSDTEITSLSGDNDDFDGWFKLSRFTKLKTLDISGLQADIDEVTELPDLETLYAVGTVQDQIFMKHNLLLLYDLYQDGVKCFLYGDQIFYEPNAKEEGSRILNTLADFGTALTVAANGKISDNNPTLPETVNGFDIEWSLSNEDNYAIVDNKIAVVDYTDIDDETLTLTATIDVYPRQASVSRAFTFDMTVLRTKTTDYLNVTNTDVASYLKRGDLFTYDIDCKASATNGFAENALPVYTEIRYAYTVDPSDVPYTNIITVSNGHNYQINEDAPLGATVTIRVDIGHQIGSEFVIDKTVEQPITVASRTFTTTFVGNGGTVKATSDGRTVTSVQYMEDADMFNDVVIERAGYLFEGWYTDSDFSDLFWNGSGTKPKMPSNDITLYAKWAANAYAVYFDGNGGTPSYTSKSVLSGTEYGELPTASSTGYTFVGWYTATSGGDKITSTTIADISSAQTLYAHWTPNNYSVKYYGNGATGGSTEKSYHTVTQYGNLTKNGFTRTGFTFAGWSWTANGSVAYTDGQSVVNLTYTPNGEVELYAVWVRNSYTVSWNIPANCAITVTRKSSPGGYATGQLSNGATVLYGDVLGVSYTANTGYSIATHGVNEVTVGTGNVGSAYIYATAVPNDYTYNVVYKSSNGTSLGSTTVTNAFGTTNTISAPAFTGYQTPPSQSVKWDSTSTKTIQFTYTPTQSNSTNVSGNIYDGLTYSITVNAQNRKSNSVDIQVSLTATLAAYAYNPYSQQCNFSVGGKSGTIQLCAYNNDWGTYVKYARSKTGTTLITIPINTTNATTVSISYYYWEGNYYGNNMNSYDGPDKSGSISVSVPAF